MASRENSYSWKILKPNLTILSIVMLSTPYACSVFFKFRTFLMAPIKYLLTFFRQPFSFVTSEVVEATCQCLLAQAEEAEKKDLGEVDTEAMVIEEFGRCLKQIIEIAKKTNHE